jgi:hypothetical protein
MGIFDGFIDFFRRVGQALEAIGKVPQHITDFAVGLGHIGEGVGEELIAVPEAIGLTAENIYWFVYYTLVYVAELIYCSIQILMNFPSCFIYYAIEILGIILYLPVRFIFWLFGMKSIEDAIWNGLYELDKQLYLATGGQKSNDQCSGYHFLHYPCWIVNKCYRCIDKKTGKRMADTNQYTNQMNKISDKFGNISRLFTDPIDIMNQGGEEVARSFVY